MTILNSLWHWPRSQSDSRCEHGARRKQLREENKRELLELLKKLRYRSKCVRRFGAELLDSEIQLSLMNVRKLAGDVTLRALDELRSALLERGIVLEVRRMACAG